MGPYDSLTDRLELIVRVFVPYSFLSVLFLLSIVSVPYPMAAFFKAPLLLMAIYYWSVYRPTLLPPWLVFVAGFLFDLLTGMPYLGLNAVLFLLCRIVVIDQRRYLTGQNFPIIWLGFGFLNIGFHTLQWLIYSVLSFQFMPVGDLGIIVILGMVVFPLIYAGLYMTHKVLPAELSGGRID